jgi:solute carrier family 36 (proton-coupled amino acid transporter)
MRCAGLMQRRLTLRHSIYKWQQDQRRLARPRSVSFAGSGVPPDPAFEHIHEPGGFRRNYVLLQATIGEDGEQQQPRMLNNFIDFLYLFGHFVSPQLSCPSENIIDVY